MRKRTIRPLVGAAAALLVVLSTAGTASAEPGGRYDADHTVDTTSDTVDADPGDGACADAEGRCSLRAAVQEANAAGEATSIELPRGTYRLTITNAEGDEEEASTGDLDVTGDVTIVAKRATVDAAGIDRAFEVMDGASLDLDRVSITGGVVTGGENPIDGSGGAIANAGRLRLHEVTLHGNRAEGPAASGGAVLNTGTARILRTTMTGNHATRAGGAIEANGGTTVVAGSVLTGNETGPEPGNGGALHLTGDGDVTVSFTRVRDNVAASEGGGLWNSGDGTMEVQASVFTSNVASGADADTGGGALFNDGGTMTVANSTIARNVADGEAGSGGGILNDQGDLSVVNTVIARNTSNRAGGGIEANIGATELTRVTLRGNSTGASPGNGGGFHITGAGDATISDSRVIANTAASEGGGLWNGSGTMTIETTRIHANVASGDDADTGGGGVFNAEGTLRISDVAISGNVADGEAGSGGGILNDQGELTVTGSLIAGNSSVRAGGGIEANVGTTILDQVALIGNETGPAPGNGGGLHITGAGDATISDSRITANTAVTEGGGLWNGSGTMTVEDSTIGDNIASGAEADNGGGGLFNNGGVLVVTGSVVDDNVADGAAGSGGGILNDQGDLTVIDTRLDGNVSVRAGGGIEANIGTTTIESSVLVGNVTGDAPGNGGAVHLTGAGDVTVDDTDVRYNEAAAEGGGLWNSATGTMTVTMSTVTFNAAPDGPDVFNDGGTFTIDGDPVSGGMLP